MADLEIVLRKLESFDPDRWARQLDTAIEETAANLAQWEQTDAERYNEKGRQHHLDRIRAPELAARERAQIEAESALRHVKEARAVLDAHTGLSDSELKQAESRRWLLSEDCERLDALTLANRIKAAIELQDRVAAWCYVRYGAARIEQLQADVETEDTVKRARARVALDQLRPAIQQAAAALESPTVVRLRQAIAETDRAAQVLRFKAGSPSRAEQIASKREQMAGYGL